MVLSKTIDVLDKYGASNDSYEKVIVECRQFSLDSDRLQEPFFRAEDLFYNLNKELLQLIHQSLCKQKLIGIKNVRILTLNKERIKPFILKGMITCANCGCVVSPEIKKGRYVYYSCTNAKKVCKRKYIREEPLVESLAVYLDRIALVMSK